MNTFTIKPVGDSALSVIFEQKISEKVRLAVARTDAAVRKLPHVIETVPAYASILVYYDAFSAGYDEMRLAVETAGAAEAVETAVGRRVEIPVCYGGSCGEDLSEVARHAGLSEEEVIAIHSGRDYPLYFIGFLPGFPYLGGLDERLFTPRRAVPRTAVPKGSVAIGGEQTGVYPSVSPGGWQLIGRTPIELFDEKNGALCRAGDTVRFVPISVAEYRKLSEREAHHA